ncbi:MAG TPA: exopolyphosphatase, partial [Ramlibacter sp.]|nr:exopolyphosphatase [Ramlibacter sp.]
RYFPDGRLTESAFERAEIAAQAVLDDALSAYAPDNWDIAYGSAGTITAVADILQRAGIGGGAVTAQGLDWLSDRLLAAGQVDRVRLEGLKDDRRPVLAGGVSVLRAVFNLMDVEEMVPAAGALRHGVLYEMLDRDGGALDDVRSATVKRLSANFQVDAAQAERVERVARQLFRQLRRGSGPDLHEHEQMLAWAARLHGIGAIISHSDAHKHGAYILENADAPGFSQSELHRLALLVLGHRGKLRKLDVDFADTWFVHQLMCLRLAVILCHARREPDLKGLALRGAEDHVRLTLRRGWSEAWPQSAHLLREECVAWLRLPWSLLLE